MFIKHLTPQLKNSDTYSARREQSVMLLGSVRLSPEGQA